jgi:hypothetical protein
LWDISNKFVRIAIRDTYASVRDMPYVINMKGITTSLANSMKDEPMKALGCLSEIYSETSKSDKKKLFVDSAMLLGSAGLNEVGATANILSNIILTDLESSLPDLSELLNISDKLGLLIEQTPWPLSYFSRLTPEQEILIADFNAKERGRESKLLGISASAPRTKLEKLEFKREIEGVLEIWKRDEEIKTKKREEELVGVVDSPILKTIYSTDRIDPTKIGVKGGVSIEELKKIVREEDSKKQLQLLTESYEIDIAGVPKSITDDIILKTKVFKVDRPNEFVRVDEAMKIGSVSYLQQALNFVANPRGRYDTNCDFMADNFQVQLDAVRPVFRENVIQKTILARQQLDINFNNRIDDFQFYNSIILCIYLVIFIFSFTCGYSICKYKRDKRNRGEILRREREDNTEREILDLRSEVNQLKQSLGYIMNYRETSITPYSSERRYSDVSDVSDVSYVSDVSDVYRFSSKKRRSRKKSCKRGRKKSGGCKKKPGPKKSKKKRKKRSRKNSRRKSCKRGRKKSGGCKKKPGPKKSRKKRSRKKSRRKSCKRGRKKSGGCKKKPGPKKSRKRTSRK